jgi:hypothetical protein
LVSLAQEEAVEIDLSEGFVGGDRLDEIVLAGDGDGESESEQRLRGGQSQCIDLLFDGGGRDKELPFRLAAFLPGGAELAQDDRTDDNIEERSGTKPTSD